MAPDLGEPARPHADLTKLIWGDVLLPGDAGFDEAAAVFSVSPVGPPKLPAVIVRARGTADVVETVKYAQQNNIPLAVKGGGHSIGNLGLCNGGLTLDLSLLRSCYVDPDKKLAYVDGGCYLGDIDKETSLYGLMVPLGHAPVTGMGLALNGGVGIGTRIFGSTAEHIMAATVVTADGVVHNVTVGNEPDLLWAIRGAGSAFGVVTKLVLRLNDISNAYTGKMVWQDDPKHETWKAIARFYRDVVFDNHHFGGNVVRAVHPEMGPVIFSQLVFAGDELSTDQKAEVLAPLRALGPVADTVGHWRYVDTQFALMERFGSVPQPHYEYWASGEVPKDKVTDEFLDLFAKTQFDEMPEELTHQTAVLLDLWGGKMNSSEVDLPVSFVARTTEFAWGCLAAWGDPAHHDVGIAHCKHVKSVLAPYGNTNAYSNFDACLEVLQDEALAKRVGGKKNLERLRVLKAKHDPGNAFWSHPLKGLAPQDTM
eukprot:jgi/Chrzof1/14494/Cz09g04250.t1